MNSEPIKVLLVEDDEDYYIITRSLLNDAGGQNYDLEWVASYEAAMQAVERSRHDVYLVDYRLGSSSGLEFLQNAAAKGCKAPMILLTGQGDRDLDVQAMKAGAADYLTKGQIDGSLLERSIRYAIERKRAELALERQARELARSNAELADFAYIASHDLKEPLRGIQNYAHFLMEDYADKLEPDACSRLETIVRLTKRLEDLVDTLLHYSRVGRVDLALADTNLQEVLCKVLDSLHVSIQESGVEIRIPKPLPVVYCDQARVGEIFRNLVTNALKYNDKEQKWIEIGYTSNGLGSSEPAASNGEPGDRNHIVFHVSDNGIGIREKHLDSIFRIFKRLHGRDKFGGGTGAGLTVVKKVVERHGGRIWVDSVFGEGTTFYFTLAEGD